MENESQWIFWSFIVAVAIVTGMLIFANIKDWRESHPSKKDQHKWYDDEGNEYLN